MKLSSLRRAIFLLLLCLAGSASAQSGANSQCIAKGNKPDGINFTAYCTTQTLAWNANLVGWLYAEVDYANNTAMPSKSVAEVTFYGTSSAGTTVYKEFKLYGSKDGGGYNYVSYKLPAKNVNRKLTGKVKFTSSGSGFATVQVSVGD